MALKGLNKDKSEKNENLSEEVRKRHDFEMVKVFDDGSIGAKRNFTGYIFSSAGTFVGCYHLIHGMELMSHTEYEEKYHKAALSKKRDPKSRG